MCEAAVHVCLDRAVMNVERALLTSDTFLGTFAVAKSNDVSHILSSKLETSTDIFRVSSFNLLRSSTFHPNRYCILLLTFLDASDSSYSEVALVRAV